MKKIFLAVLSLVIVIPWGVLAEDELVEKISLEQKGEFQTVAHMEENNFEVPTMIDVPLVLNNDSRKFAIIADSTGNIVPSTVVTQVKGSEIVFKIKDSFGNWDARNMVDGKIDTFTEFPFEEVKSDGEYEVIKTGIVSRDSVSGGEETIISEEKYTGNKGTEPEEEKNVVEIDLTSNRPFRTDSMNFNFGKNVERPTRVRIVAVAEDGSEQVLLPEEFFVNNTIHFPEANTDHFRVTLHYAKPLRISEITFAEKDKPRMTENLVRFIAQPQMSYDIFHNTKNSVKIKSMESPDFDVDEYVRVVRAESVRDNSFYKTADTDKDGVVDGADNCVSVENADQVDRNKNNKGDACEDFDHDGIINAKDNCPNTANQNQKDSDTDGIGNVCDLEEGRLMEKYPWIPYVVLAVVFLIVVGLMAKTLKNK
ncbi:MAG: thrombospondin type 3 repeat-containing protein [Patescibacteria group bacterium]